MKWEFTLRREIRTFVEITTGFEFRFLGRWTSLEEKAPEDAKLFVHPDESGEGSDRFA